MRKFYLSVFLFLYISLFAQKDYKILSSSNNSIVVEYSPIYTTQEEITLSNSTYIDIELYNADYKETETGSPLIPSRIFNIAVPSEFGNSIKVLSSNYSTISGKIKPQPNFSKKNNLTSYNYAESPEYNNYSNSELVTFGEYGLVRDLGIQNVSVNPIQFDPIKQEIILYSKIVFRMDFANANLAKKIVNSDLTKYLAINSDVALKWGKDSNLSKKNAVVNSVLSTGDWYRFEASEESIYKLSKSFLSGLGIDINNVDPRTIKIYNNGGYNLPEEIYSERSNDLVENSIYVEGEDDGKFDDADFILFYGRGVTFWEYNDISDKIASNRNYSSKKNYYWLTFGGELGKRMEVQANETGNPVYTQTTTKAFRLRNNDNRNLIGTGRLFIEDDYSSSSKTKTYTETLNGRVDGSQINYSVQFVNGAKHSNVLTIDENGTRIYSRSLSGASTTDSDYQYGALSPAMATSYSGTLPDNRSVLKFTFNPISISDKGHLDLIEIEYLQDMKASLTDLPLIFFSEQIDGVVKYDGNVFNNSSFLVFNLTDYANPKRVEIEYSGGEFTFSNTENSGFTSKYIAVQTSNYKEPTNAVKITNSNLRGYQEGAKYIIIAPRQFSEQAVRLKNYRESDAQYKLSSFVAYTDEIYNEFSGGLTDPTALRDFLKYAYENWNIQPEYVLLFGDGDYDYFNTLGKGLNFIPTYQTVTSLHEINSYSTDDYYSRISGNDKLADLAIGRLPVTSQGTAKISVDKIIEYESSPLKGLWQNKITLLADDGLTSDSNDGSTHTRQSEVLSESYIPKSFDRNKIYLSNYQTVNTGFGRRKPDCNIAIIDAINNGTLIFNYVGHGNPDVFAHETVFDRSVSIPQLRNEELFFLTAATCDFGKYDDPEVISGCEEMLLLENAGMIGGVCAIRPVYSGQNDALNKTLYTNMFGLTDSSGLPVPIGVAYYKLKQKHTSTNDEKFHLFADPALRLNIPKLPVQISSVNNAGINDTVNIKALSEVKIEGKVLNSNSSDSQFEGEGIVTVFDSERTIQLEDINYPMTVQGGVIFRGRVSVTNGEFSTSFAVPKDISYENKNGKIVAYFFNDEIDGVGYTDNIIVGGTDSSKVNDGKGPEIEILYDDESESSYLVNPNFKLRVKLYDETGLNTTGTGIGHKLEAILNDDEQNSIDLTNYFVGDLNSGGKSGEVNYNFTSLDPGEYKIKVNAWDVYNNFAAQDNYFTVVDDDNLVIREVYNYPNPFSSNTYFTFQHNLESPLNIKIKVYTIAGRVIKVIESNNIEEKFVKIEWNGKDEDNNTLGNGTYLYKIIAESSDGKYKENILGKMAVIR